MMARKTDDLSFTDQVRAAVRSSGFQQREIARRLNVTDAAISRFLSGGIWLAEPTVNELAKMLGLRVVRSRREKKGT